MFSKKKDHPRNAEAAASSKAPSQAETVPEQAAPAPSPSDDTAEVPAEAQAEPQPAVSSQEAKELAVLKDRYARLLADFDNFRKRQIREREELIKRANEELFGDLLPVVDHLELALAKTPDPADPFVSGVRLVYEQLLSLLSRYGMTVIEAKGQPFNPEFHEALSQMSSPTVPAHTVIDQFRRGWLLAGRLLRPAQVIVSSGLPDPAQADAESASVSD